MSKKATKQDIAEQLSNAASDILREAMGAETALETKVDAFKAVSAYYLGVSKVKPPKTDDEPEASFSTFRRKIEAVK